MTLTPAMICEIDQWKADLPELSKDDLAYVIGHKAMLETTITGGDGSWERSRLSGIIKQFAWRLAYCRYVESCLAENKLPMTYDQWVKQ